MDTNLKNNKYMTSSWFILSLILILAIISVASYGPIKNKHFPKEDDKEEYIESYSFIRQLGDLTNHLIESSGQGAVWTHPDYDGVKNVLYLISNKDKSINLSNMEESDNLFMSEDKDKVDFYLHAKFDDLGQPQDIESSLGNRLNQASFFNIFMDSPSLTVDEEPLIDGEDQSRPDGQEASIYSNLQITYMVPQGFDKHDDIFSYGMKRLQLDRGSSLSLIAIIGGISILILIILAFTFPYARQKETPISRAYIKIPLEIKGFLWLLFLCVNPGGLFLYFNLSDHSIGSANLVSILYDANIYFYLIGIPVTFISLLFIYLTLVYIKHIYHVGFREGLVENTLLGSFFLNYGRKLRSYLRRITRIDISKRPHKEIFISLIINLFILWLIALGGSFSFILAILWSGFLFKYLVTLMEKIQDLNQASLQLAQGDFDIQLDENMDMLSPIAKNLNNIKAGFQLAVDRETKSERMRAELITNVSHDLKTPLTSIITYIDLLKNQDNTIDEQKKYINILDKKAKRLKLLIEDLFEASKASSGNIELHLDEVDVIALFRQSLGELEEKINKSSLKMRVNMPDKKIICLLDGQKTNRIFENIMGNILKYSMPNSRVYIDVEEGEEDVSFTFKNISSYEMNFDATEITERFVRGDSARTSQGSGLGLSIAKSLAELQESNLEIVIDGDLFKLIIIFPKS